MPIVITGSLRLHTRNLAEGQSMTIIGSDGALMLSYQMSTATGDNGTLTGNMDFRCSSDGAAVPSTALVIPAGGGNTFTSTDTQKGLEFEIACVQGTMKVIIGF